MKYAEERFEELDFTLTDYDLPNSFFEKYTPALRNEFIDAMVTKWEICLKLDEEERQEAILEKRKGVHLVRGK